MSIEAMKLALEALYGLSEPYDVLKAQNALRQALEQAEQAQPVAWIEHHKAGDNLVWDEPHKGTPLYTSPPQRQPLTDEELRQLADKHLYYQPEGYLVSGVFEFARAIEAAYGIKGEA